MMDYLYTPLIRSSKSNKFKQYCKKIGLNKNNTSTNQIFNSTTENTQNKYYTNYNFFNENNSKIQSSHNEMNTLNNNNFHNFNSKREVEDLSEDSIIQKYHNDNYILLEGKKVTTKSNNVYLNPKLKCNESENKGKKLSKSLKQLLSRSRHQGQNNENLSTNTVSMSRSSYDDTTISKQISKYNDLANIRTLFSNLTERNLRMNNIITNDNSCRKRHLSNYFLEEEIKFKNSKRISKNESYFILINKDWIDLFKEKYNYKYYKKKINDHKINEDNYLNNLKYFKDINSEIIDPIQSTKVININLMNSSYTIFQDYELITPEAYDTLEKCFGKEKNEENIELCVINIDLSYILVKYNSKMIEIIKIKDDKRVFAVKSKFTAMFRRQWLNEATWGKQDKQDLKKITYLDHAADAIVIANLRPEYVVLAGEKQKLSRMYYQAGKKITPEYEASKKACIDSLYLYYGMNKKVSEDLLRSHSSRLTPMITGISDEVDKRLWDKNIFKQFWNVDNLSDDDIDAKCEDIFKTNIKSYYKNDPEFAESINMPLVSYKPDHKYRGKITDENAISIKEINGQKMQLNKKSIMDLSSKHLDSIYTDDNTLIEQLKSIFEGKNDSYTINDYLSENNLSYFTDKSGRKVNKVTLMSEAPSRWLTKQISDNNYTLMNDRSYYCIELYEDNDGNNHLLGIAMSDIVHKYGKIWLRSDYQYPEDYSKHIMYIFSGDYIRVTNKKGQIKFDGYYKSVKNISRNLIYCISDNQPLLQICSITSKDRCIKLSVELLGIITGCNNGEGIKCGEPLSLLKEKN